MISGGDNTIGATPATEADDTSRRLGFDSTLLEGSSNRPQLAYFTDRQSKVDPCITAYIDEKIDLEEMQKCLLAKYEEKPEKTFELVREIERTRKEKEAVKKDTTGLGSFGFLVAPTFRVSKMQFPGVFKDWNKSHPEHKAPSDDGFISNNGTMGVRLALSTNPGLMRGFDGFRKFSMFDFEFYSADAPENGDINQMVGEFLKYHVFLPVAQKSFLELGGTLLSFDSLTGHYIPSFFNPVIGINAQVHGEAIGTPERLLEVLDKSSFFQSYTMFRVASQMLVGGTDTSHILCNRIPGDDTNYPCQLNDISHKILLPGNDDNNTSDLRTTLELFGEERGLNSSVSYSLSASHYLHVNRMDFGGRLVGERYISPAVRLFVDVRIRFIEAIGDAVGKPTVAFPESAQEFTAQLGLRLVPSNF